MADNLPLDYSCPHPSTLDDIPATVAYVPGNRCSSFATERKLPPSPSLLSLRPSIYLHRTVPLPLTFFSLSLSLPIPIPVFLQPGQFSIVLSRRLDALAKARSRAYPQPHEYVRTFCT